jgi:hypothetical protein
MTTATAPDNNKGLPVWIPLLALVAAFVVAMLVAIRICPTLTALVIPPDPPLPPVATTLKLHETKVVGVDEWVYSTDAEGCEVAQFYVARVGNCVYDPDSGCNGPSRAPGGNPISPLHVVRCQGNQSFGLYRVDWTVYVTTGIPEGGRTSLRVIRTVAN